MKWARVINPDHPVSKQDAVCFDEFPDLESLKKTMVNPENQWTDCIFKPVPDFESVEDYAAFQVRYENFCGGYLLFYDDVVRSKSVDHTIYCQWSKGKDENGNYAVIVYLSPAPMQTLNNSTKQAGQVAGQQVGEKNLFSQQSMATNGGTVDPPPPPPPPPPTMH